MPLRFHKQIKLGDFVKLNVNKQSLSVSAGVPGFHFNIGRDGPMIDVGLPGGLSYRQNLRRSKKEQAKEEHQAEQERAAQSKGEPAQPGTESKTDRAPTAQDKSEAQPTGAGAPPAKTRHTRPKAAAGRVQSVFPPVDAQSAPAGKPPTPDSANTAPAQPISSPGGAEPPPNPPGTTASTAPAGNGSTPAPAQPPPAPAAGAQVPPEETPFQLGFVAYQGGDFIQAYRHFTGLVTSRYPADALLMAGITSSYLDRDEEAVTYLSTLLEEGQPPLPGDPESLVTRYLPDATIAILVTQFTTVNLLLDLTAALLLYVDLLEREERPDLAIATLEDVFQQNPGFRLAQLCLGNLYFQQGRFEDIFTLFTQHTPELEAEDDVAVEIMVYWALALTHRDMFDAADKVYRRALARKKGINPDLRLLVLYSRADLYERWGQKAEARKNFEKIFAEAPDFFDVRARIAALGGVEPSPEQSVTP